MVSDDDDLTLLRRWKAGDRDAGDVLITRHFKKIQRFFRRVVADEALVNELIQRTFVRCTDKLAGFQERSSFSSFLYGIARHILLERFRELRRDGRSSSLEVEQTPIVDLDPSPFTAIEAREDRKLLIHALRELPLDDQILVMLYFFEDLSAPQVCEILGVPETTLRARIRSCRKRVIEIVRRLAESPQQLESTLMTINAWADAMKAQVERNKQK
jgi:RNA polymerase sigma factor (sigma-70 family)